MKQYQVLVTREGSKWLASVEGLAGAHTFANSLPDLKDNVREVIELVTDDGEDFEVIYNGIEQYIIYGCSEDDFETSDWFLTDAHADDTGHRVFEISYKDGPSNWNVSDWQGDVYYVDDVPANQANPESVKLIATQRYGRHSWGTPTQITGKQDNP